MGVTSTNYDLYKEVYDDNTVKTIINEEAPTLEALKKGTEKPGESGWLLPIRYQGNEKGQGSQNESENFRSPGRQKAAKWNVQDKMFIHNIHLTDRSMRLSKTNKQAYAEAKTFQIDNGFVDSVKELNAQHYRDGSGRIAQLNGAVVNSDTITFDNGIPTHLRPGIVIDIVTAADVKEVDSREIIDLDIANNQITLDKNVSASDDSYIVREDVRDNAPAEGKEITGFKLGTDDGTLSATFQGQNRTTNNALDGITIDAGGANLSADVLQRAQTRMTVLGGSKKKSNIKVFLNPVQIRKYFQITTPMKEYQNDSRVDAGHKQVPTWNGRELVEDSDCGFDEAYIINSGDYKRYYLDGDLAIMDPDGNQMRQIPNTPVYGLQIGTYMNIGLKDPKSHARIHNLALPTW